MPTNMSWRYREIQWLHTVSTGAILLVCAMRCTSALGQASTDACGFTGGAKWTVGATCNPQSFKKPNAYNPSMAPAGCNGTNNDDAFGWFAGTGNPVIVTYTPPSGGDAVMHVFSGTCAAPVLEACSDNCCDGAVESVTIPTTLGTNYIVRVQRWGDNSGMNGSLCVYNAPPPLGCGDTFYDPGGPAGDYPNNSSYTTTICPSPPGYEVTINFSAFNTEAGYDEVVIHDGSTTAAPVIATFSGNGIPPATTSSPGNCLTLEFNSDFSNTRAGWTAQVTCQAPPPPPANDNPCNAIAIAVNATCSYTTTTNAGATASTGIPDPGCGGSIFHDVWYSFVAPATGVVVVETQAGTMTDAAMAVYSGTCAGTLTLLTCDDNSGAALMPFQPLTGLTPGQTYLLRVWNYTGSRGTFSLCLHGPLALPAGNCIHVLELFDRNGNGWGGSSVGVSIDGGAYTNYSVTANYNIVLISLSIGQTITLQYNGGGPNQGQNSYDLSYLSNGDLLFTSGSPPAVGITYDHLVDCQPPPHPPQDCLGGITLCDNQAITNNSDDTGETQDLDASNRGCLAAGERQGTWYFFSPQSIGTMTFSINPSNGIDDYDFAIWGPYATAQCPVGPPLRFSYDAPGPYTTGLNTTATDTSEGAAGDGWVEQITIGSPEVGQVYVMYIDNYSQSGQEFSLTWTNNPSLDCATLPVEMLSLEATARDPYINVTWATATEQNSHHFTVERSPDNEAFTPIGTVAAAGNSQFRTDYLFVDQSPFRGVNYYRLEQVDNDGASMRTHTVVAVLSEGDGRPSIYPNPASDVLNVVFATPLDAPVQLQVQDALGRAVAMVAVPMVAGQQIAHMPIEKLAQGWYNLRIAAPGGQMLNGGGFLKR